jgi:hypothetical protein
MGTESVICSGAQGRPSIDFNSRLPIKKLFRCPGTFFCFNFQKYFNIICGTGELAHALRFLASVVSQSFVAFGDILELHKKFLELSGGINRIFELEEFLRVAQRSKFHMLFIR